jgi:very-short-patch-repair endonuclease
MRLYTLNGKTPIYKNVNKYLINWDEGSRSKLQKRVKDFFFKHWKCNIVYEQFPVYGTRMKVDFLNATTKTAVEVNGDQHIKFNKFFHKNSRTQFLKSIKRDLNKAQWLKKNNFSLIELYTEDVNALSEEYLEKYFSIKF